MADIYAEVSLPGGPGTFTANAALLDDVRNATPLVKPQPIVGAGGGGLSPDSYMYIVSVVLHGSFLFASGFFNRLGELTADGLAGEGTRKTYKEYRGNQNINQAENSGVIPLGYSCKSVVFSVHRVMDNDEQAKAFGEAAALLESGGLPEDESTPIFLFWDGASGKWREGPPDELQS